MHELTIVLALIVSVTALGATGLAVLLLRNRSLNTSLDFCLNEIAILEERLERTLDFVEDMQSELNSVKRLARAKPNNTKRITKDEELVSKVPLRLRSSLPEQRKRVLKLAENGSDSGTIAATLGMSPGEVELIMRLNTFSANAA